VEFFRDAVTTSGVALLVRLKLRVKVPYSESDNLADAALRRGDPPYVAARRKSINAFIGHYRPALHPME